MTAVSNMATFNMNGGGMMRSTMPNVTLTIQPSTSSMTSSQPRMMNSHHRFQRNDAMPDVMGDGPGRRLRKNVANVRRHVDYVSTVLNHCENRLWQYGKQRVLQQPDILYQPLAVPADATPDVPVDCILTKFIRTAMNKVKCPVYSVCWSPEGKRLITGCQTGEFTLWNGTAFNFETILQAHDSAIRALKWASNEQWLLSADQGGYVKYWQPNMNNAHMFSAHKDEAIRGLAFAPTDVKFATASDDGTARVWDFARYSEERVLRGHGAEVRCIDWHPTKGLLVTGSRDTQQPVKIWDPKTGSCLATLQEHKSSVMAVEFNKNGNWLLTGGRDHLVKLYDIRMMKEVKTFRAHKKEVISLAWHPIHEGLFVSGGGDGSIVYWMVDGEKEIGLLEHAHDQAIWSMKWHPLGHILATGSNDNNTKFWARNRPGDTVEDIFGLSSHTTMIGHLDKEREPRMAPLKSNQETQEVYRSDTFIPGMGLDENLYEQLNKDGNLMTTDTTLLVPDDMSRQNLAPMIGAKRTLIKQPPAKKAQRQFERMWNNSKGIGAGTDDFAAMIGGMGREDAESSGAGGGGYGAPMLPPTKSFLGPPTTGGSLLGPSQPRPPQEYHSMPPPPQQGPQGAPWRGPGAYRPQGQWNPQNQQNRGPPGPPGPGSYGPPPQSYGQNGQGQGSFGGPPSYGQNQGYGQQAPPPSRPPASYNPPPQQQTQSADIDYRNSGPPQSSADVDMRQMPQQPPQPIHQNSGGGGVPDSWRAPPTNAQMQQQQQQQMMQRMDPRRDPRIAARQSDQLSPTGGPPPPQQQQGPNQWMPQFDGGPNRRGGMHSAGRGRGRGQPY
ncbi:hypothetical protein GCK72_004681 [Caenorhabditis remanei]|uniref:Uncharacterized protein n=1 Tax=Caenorhabditis remanei TaxID=31234 RepID=A0A6A5HCT5_CAERE|nr:hypothetical protein GCK72_004681 [Caenorhabditis remanei]KAF1764731.1 hypothetical protein GCK72_004681 [Caenorhabditis remanei]